MSDEITERRATPRFALVLVAEVTHIATDTKLHARSSDLSRGGCYIDTLNPVSQGEDVKVHLQRGGEAFECSGKVIYTSQSLGMGIGFDSSTSSEKLIVLDHWLQEASRNSA